MQAAFPRGTVRRDLFASSALADNPLGDPAEREVLVYLPPNYDDDPERRFPVIFALPAFLSSGHAFLNWSAFQKTLPEYLDELAAATPERAVIAVFPDCFTRYGGSQYLNSSATGRYEDYLLELVRYVDATYRTRGDGARGITGHSSGGYGALVQAMRHPEIWSAVGCRSGDMAFELCYGRDFPAFCAAVERAGGVDRWLDEMMARERKTGEDFQALNVLAMSACYSPDPHLHPLPIAFPIDIETMEFIPAVWERWLALDPVHMVERAEIQEALRSLKLLYFECGRRDEYLLHFGARRLARKLDGLGIPFEYVETDDPHGGTSYRHPVVLALLAAALGS